MRTVFLKVMAVVAVAQGLGCTEAVPTFDNIMSVGLPGPTFSGSAFRSQQILTTNSPVSMSGECPVDIQFLEWSLDSGVSWLMPTYVLSVVDPVDLDCSDGTFSINVFNPGALLPFSNDGDRGRIRIRGIQTDGNHTNHAELEVVYDYPNVADLAFTQEPPAQVMAGDSLQMTIELRDANNNLVSVGPEANLTVTLSVHSGTGALLGTVEKTSVNGSVTFDSGEGAHLTITGDYVLRAKVTGGYSDDTSTFEITPAAAGSLIWAATPATPKAGDMLVPSIEIRDSFGNVVDSGPASAAVITLSIDGGPWGATLMGTTSLAAVNGVATWVPAYGLSLDLVGIYTLEASMGALSANSAAIPVGPGAAATLAWTTEPSHPTTAGSDLLPVLEIRDAFGNVVTSGPDSGAAVTLSVFSGPGALVGTTTKAASSGVVTFLGADDLNLQVAGAYTLKASKPDTTGAGGTSAFDQNSAGFSITHAAAAKLAWKTQPTNNTPMTAPLTFEIEIRDSYNNPVSTGAGATGTVNVELWSGTGALSGTLAKAATNGVAAWTAPDNASINAGGAKVLRASSGALSTADSNLFNIVGYTATLSSTPANPSNTGTLSVTVGGSNVTHYKYKVGAAGSINCGADAGYSSATSIVTPISDNLSPFGEGSLKLCVRGGDGTYFQLSAAATSHTWTRDVTAPPAPTAMSLQDPTYSPYPDPTPTVYVEGPVWANVTIGLYTDSSCLVQVGAEPVASGNSVDITASALTPGIYWFYADATDTAGNKSSCFAGGFSYEFDPLAPFVVTVQPVYPSFQSWNDYVEFDNDSGGTTRYNQDEEVCAGATPLYSSCIHGGELRKVAVTGYGTCANLTAEDQLAAFDWECELVTGTGTATFFSKGLKPGKGLRDLINFPSGTGFLPNKVIIRSSGAIIAESMPNSWWSNSVMPLPDNSAATLYSGHSALSTAGTIYVLTNDRETVGYHITADRIGVVTGPGVTLGFKDTIGVSDSNCNISTGLATSPTARALFCSSGRKFLWMEADMNGSPNLGPNPAEYGIVASGIDGGVNFGWRQSRIQNTAIRRLDQNSGHDGVGLTMTYSFNNRISGLIVSNARAGGVHLKLSQNNIFSDIKIAGAKGALSVGRSALVYLGLSSHNNRFYGTRLGFNSASTATGLTVDNANNNVFAGLNIYNIGSPSASGKGVYVYNSSGSIFSQVISSASGHSGAELTRDQGSIITHSTFVNNYLAGIFLSDSSGSGATTMNSLAIGNSSYGIDTDILHNRGVSIYGSVASRTPSGAISYRGTGGITLMDHFGRFASESIMASGSADLRSNDITGAFVGRIGTVDGANETNNLLGDISFSSLLDMLGFSNPYRSWGKDGGFPGASVANPCSTDDICGIWDWRVRSFGSLYNLSRDGLNPNPSFIAAAPCPTFVNGNATITANGKTFLKHALEINLDGRGNDNGLCESYEACTYTPNIGAYQGEGAIDPSAKCDFTNGTIEYVDLFQYPTAGQ